MSEEKFTLPAYAKINLSLSVEGRRPDGYHEISTVFQTITLHDSLTFELTLDGSIKLICSDPDIPTDESNLVMRAATALRERFSDRRGVRILLEKRIPAGGGLGGGSSNAAVTLVALSHLWSIRTDKKELEEIGAQLGADVPFFLTGGTALGTGTGTKISPLADTQKMHLAVVTPVARVSTSEAYKLLNAPALTKAEGVVNLSVSRTEADFSGFLCGVTRNDFEAVVFGLYPEIERARDALTQSGARRAMLSGSGSSVFGVFDSTEEAERACEVLRGNAGWQVFACATLTRAEYLHELGRSAAVLQSSREG